MISCPNNVLKLGIMKTLVLVIQVYETFQLRYQSIKGRVAEGIKALQLESKGPWLESH